jgi:hypothetical protein
MSCDALGEPPDQAWPIPLTVQHLGVRERRAVRGHVVGAAGEQERGAGARERDGQPAGREGAGPRAARAGVG